MKKRTATETKELILNTAIQEFAKHGFYGLRVDELALKAGVNKATIYYHYKDKSFIYERILFLIAEQTIKQLSENLSNDLNSKDKLGVFLDIFLDKKNIKKDLSKIMMQELAFGGNNITDGVKKEFFKVFDILTTIISEGIKEKIFKPIDPILIHSILNGSINYHLTTIELIEKENNENFKLNIDNKYVENIKEMILNYIIK